MSNTPIQISYSLEAVLTRIEEKIDDFRQETNQKFQQTNQKIDAIQKEVIELKIGQARLEAQIWTLIGVLSTTVVGAVIRFVITALPGSNP
jgi:septal ring factor EnvC (AmiA/AmiB activator)